MSAMRLELALMSCIVLTTGTVGLLKASSPIPVPWRALRYGGSTPHYLPFLAPDEASFGGGWPCAHASGAFALMGLYFISRDSKRSLAWLGFAGACGLGVLYVASQVMRGAHFPSHGVWSFLLAWTICAGLYAIPFRSRLIGATSAEGPLQERRL